MDEPKGNRWGVIQPTLANIRLPVRKFRNYD